MSRAKANIKTINKNRNTSNYRKNIIEGKLKNAGIQKPKDNDVKKMRKIMPIFIIAWVILLIAAFIFFRMIGALAVMMIGVMVVFIVLSYIDNKEKLFIKYYKAIGVSKKEYLRILSSSKRQLSAKQIKKFSKFWDKINQTCVL